MVKLINATSPVCGKEVFTFGPRLVPVAGPVDPGLQHIYDPSYDPTAQFHTEEDRSSRPGQIRRLRRSGHGISVPEGNSEGGKDHPGTDEGISIFKRIVRLVDQDRDDEDDDRDVFFDWAQGNLEEFWGINETSTRDGSHLAWMAEQFYKLAVSLHQLHLNPENLVTEYLEMGGAKDPAHLSHRLSILHHYIRHTRLTYRAPEDDLTDGPSCSLSSGIFSMGCVFLEYVTWFLTGKEGVEEFSSARATLEPVGYWVLSDMFFTMSQDGHIATLKMEVKGWIRHLEQQPECCSYLYELLNFIESRMLEPDRRKRAGIEETMRALRKLRDNCRRNKAFYHGQWKEREYSPSLIGTP